MAEKNVDINPPPPNTMQATITNPTTKETTMMTQEQYYEYVKERGRIISDIFNGKKETLVDGQVKETPYMDYFASLSKENAKKVTAGIKEYANAKAKQKLLGIE